MEFRLLKPDEIEVRVSRIFKGKKSRGVSLLLYKDARCDMNILDETVGSLNWQRHHSRENANCIVSIWDEDKNQWIEKEDTGTESKTEAEKGLASDSFKRACFNVGIGRELYTSPKDMTFWEGECEITEDNKCFDRFCVESIEYKNRQIVSVLVKDIKTGTIKSFTNSNKSVKESIEEVQNIGQIRKDALKELNTHSKEYIQNVAEHYGVKAISELTAEQCEDYLKTKEKKK